MARHVEPLDFLRNWKLNPWIFSDNVFSSTIIFCTPDFFVGTKNVGHHREREERWSRERWPFASHISQQYSSTSQYTDTWQLDRSFTAAHQVTSLLICCINYTKNFTVLFLCETTEVAESWENSHERRQPPIRDNSLRSWSTSLTWRR